MIHIDHHSQQEPAEELLSVDRDNPLEPAEDYAFLRQEGIGIIERLSGKVWTDYNSTDPGITLLEAMCYALTDLGYRTAMEVPDLLARPAGSEQHGSAQGPLAHEILPAQPLTIADFRKLIIDTEGVRNAYIEDTADNEVFLYYRGGPELGYASDRGGAAVSLRGLYRVLVEFEFAVLQNNTQAVVIGEIRRRLQAHRNLCEDFVVISEVEYEDVPLRAELVVHEGADIERISAEICNLVQNGFGPGIPFYSLWQLQHNGVPTEDIFDGPFLKHGFIDTEELMASTRQRKILLSDLINPILGIPGVIAVRRFSRKNDDPPFFALGERPEEDEPSRGQKMKRLDVSGSAFTFVSSGDQHREGERKPNKQRVLALYSFLQSQQKTTKLKKHHNQIEAPTGTFMDLAHYFPFQQGLPDCYLDERQLPLEEDISQIFDRWDEPGVEGIVQGKAPLKQPGEDASEKRGGPGHRGGNESETGSGEGSGEMTTRRKQVLQLKGFLLVFEQIMADYCARLGQLGSLFSGQSLTQTCFPGILSQTQIKDVEKLYFDLHSFRRLLLALTESEDEFLNQRNNLLDHLLARVGEAIDGRSINAGGTHDREQKALVHAKELVLQEQLQLSKNRGSAFNYTNKQEIWDTPNVGGVKKRISRLLGLADYTTQSLTRDWLRVEKHEQSAGLFREVVIIRGEKSGRELLRSKGHESDSEIRTILEYILQHGADKKSYAVDELRGQHFYQLQRVNTEDEIEVVTETFFDNARQRDEHFEELIHQLTDFLNKENFHLVEHILLRPMIEPQERSTVQLLLPRETPPEAAAAAGADPGAAPSAPVRTQRYQFKKTKKRISGNREVLKLSLVIRVKGEPVLMVVDEDFRLEEDLKERERAIRDAGADEANYVKDRDADGRNIIHLKDKNRLLARGVRPYTADEMRKEIEELVSFFSFEETRQGAAPVQEEERETMAANADAYSLQVSYFIPSWPARFTNAGFRHQLEKCIAAETPAHIYPRIYWLDYREMRDFEAAYKPWLATMAEEGIPDTGVVNHLVNVLNQFAKAYFS